MRRNKAKINLKRKTKINGKHPVPEEKVLRVNRIDR